jgi:hypothetical protein
MTDWEDRIAAVRSEPCGGGFLFSRLSAWRAAHVDEDRRGVDAKAAAVREARIASPAWKAFLSTGIFSVCYTDCKLWIA